MKTKTYNTELVDCEVQLPLYAYFQEDGMNEEYVKITHKGTYILKFDYIKSFQFIPNNKDYAIIDESYIRNQTTESHYDEALVDFKDYIK